VSYFRHREMLQKEAADLGAQTDQLSNKKAATHHKKPRAEAKSQLADVEVRIAEVEAEVEAELARLQEQRTQLEEKLTAAENEQWLNELIHPDEGMHPPLPE